jgi:hypothetical protein
MSTSKLWSALLLCCVACGSSFHSNDISSGGDGNGGDGTGTGGAVAGGSTNSGGSTGSSGGASNAGGNSGGVTSSGGGVSVGGDLSIGGHVGIAGGNSGGGDVSVSGSASGGGAAGSAATAGAGGSTGADCTKLWATYTALVTKAKTCDSGVAGECVANSNIINECSCAVPVNQKSPSYSDAKNALQAWRDAGCTTKLCPCAAPGTPACTLDTGTSYTCTASGVVAQ